MRERERRKKREKINNEKQSVPNTNPQKVECVWNIFVQCRHKKYQRSMKTGLKERISIHGRQMWRNLTKNTGALLALCFL